MNTKVEKVVETMPVRLTGDETRALMKLSAANGVPTDTYHACGLVDLGIAAKVESPAKDYKSEKAACWDSIREAAKNEHSGRLRGALERLDSLSEQSIPKKIGFILTPLGKQIARGVTVRLNSQAKQMWC